MPEILQARGKVLLMGEYAILDGALSVALPVVYGQIMRWEKNISESLHWEAKDQGELWFQAVFDKQLQVVETTDSEVARRLGHILSCARILAGQKNLFLSTKISTATDYPRFWGLGSSATMLALLAAFSGVNPYLLQADTFGGSGYDVACAFAKGPILYQRTQVSNPFVAPVSIAPEVRRYFYFVYSGRKQSSTDEIHRYLQLSSIKKKEIVERISSLTQAFLKASDFETASEVLKEHENQIGLLIQKTPIQVLQFQDFEGVVKSLGAWGGDFLLACTKRPSEEVKSYFETRNLWPVFQYHEFIYDTE